MHSSPVLPESIERSEFSKFQARTQNISGQRNPNWIWSVYSCLCPLNLFLEHDPELVFARIFGFAYRVLIFGNELKSLNSALKLDNVITEMILQAIYKKKLNGLTYLEWFILEFNCWMIHQLRRDILTKHQCWWIRMIKKNDHEQELKDQKHH